jgi:CubicO group peptidase (beta-lactamase class C family)
MKTKHKGSAGVFCLIFVLSLTGAPKAQSTDVRDRLTVQDLFEGNYPQLVQNRYFMPIGEERPSPHQLSGTLRFSETPMVTIHPESDWQGSGQNLFPAFSLHVISHEGYLIPLDRGIIYSGGKRQSFYNIIVSPGRVWQESTDNGYSRASFPFVLTSNVLGEVRNGVATFVFNNLEISNVAVQITQETAPDELYVRCDFHAMVPVQYDRESFSESERIARDYKRELDARLPVRPWSDLGASWQEFNPELEPSDVSAAVLLMDGVLYIPPVRTRAAGPHPYPESMRHGVFSVTKSLAMGLSMFYLAERYGEQIFDRLITDYVPPLADHPGWTGVTFEHALNMATGTYAEDQGPEAVPFILAKSALDKLETVRALPDAPPAPGEAFDYASCHTFTLSYALNQYVKSREGPQADYWYMVRDDVLHPLGIPHLPVTRTVESDGRFGTPVMGWGSFPNVHEAAKIAQLIQDQGAYRGQQLLNRAKVREALFKTSKRGLQSGTLSRYLHSVRMIPIETEACQVEVIYMLGYGGNCVVMIPSGLSVIRFADADRYPIGSMVRIAERYRSSCR